MQQRGARWQDQPHTPSLVAWVELLIKEAGKLLEAGFLACENGRAALHETLSIENDPRQFLIHQQNYQSASFVSDHFLINRCPSTMINTAVYGSILSSAGPLTRTLRLNFLLRARAKVHFLIMLRFLMLVLVETFCLRQCTMNSQVGRGSTVLVRIRICPD